MFAVPVTLSIVETSVRGRAKSGTESAPIPRGDCQPRASGAIPGGPCEEGPPRCRGIPMTELATASRTSTRPFEILAAILVRRPGYASLTGPCSMFGWFSPQIVDKNLKNVRQWFAYITHRCQYFGRKISAVDNLLSHSFPI